MLTEHEFINSQIVIWGEDYIYNLIDSGYMPISTDHGWKWIYSSNPADFLERVNSVTALDANGDLCYTP